MTRNDDGVPGLRSLIRDGSDTYEAASAARRALGLPVAPPPRQDGAVERRTAVDTRARFDVCMAAVRECERRKGRMEMQAEVIRYLIEQGFGATAIAIRQRCPVVPLTEPETTR